MSDHTDDRVWRRIARLVAGEMATEEGARLRRELEDDPETRQLVSEAQQVWEMADRFGAEATSAERKAEWRRLRKRIGEQDDERSRRTFGNGLMGPMLRIAAILVMVIGAYLILGTNLFRSGPDRPAIRRYTTKQAQMLTVRLGDGSTVQIGPESELRVPESYPKSGRRVKLSGLGYFDVESSSSNPFLVMTPGGTVGAVGTQFAVRAFAGETSDRVVVREGVVRLETGEDEETIPTLVHAGHEAEFTDERVLSVAEADVNRELAWRNGRLSFTDVPLRQVLRDLERWYALDFRIGDESLGERRFTGDFSRESNKQIADILSAVLGITYEVRNDTVVFIPSPGERPGSTHPRSSARNQS